MFDTVILLTGPAEHSVFTSLLRGHNPALTVIPVFTTEDLMAIEAEWLGRSRLISFTTTVVVPPHVIDRLGYGAYNFHPGPPQYPGSAPAHFALDDRARAFGCTVHRMIASADAGPIVEVETFDIPEKVSVAGLEEIAYTGLVQIFWRMAGVLSTQPTPLIERALRWGPKRDARKARQQFSEIPATILPDHRPHRIKIVGTDDFGIVPGIGLHGFPLRVVAAVETDPMVELAEG